MPLFGKSTKSPAELVKALKEAVNSLERGDKKAEKAQEDVSKNLVSILKMQRLFSSSNHSFFLLSPFVVVVFVVGDYRSHTHHRIANFINTILSQYFHG